MVRIRMHPCTGMSALLVWHYCLKINFLEAQKLVRETSIWKIAAVIMMVMCVSDASNPGNAVGIHCAAECLFAFLKICCFLILLCDCRVTSNLESKLVTDIECQI